MHLLWHQWCVYVYIWSIARGHFLGVYIFKAFSPLKCTVIFTHCLPPGAAKMPKISGVAKCFFFVCSRYGNAYGIDFVLLLTLLQQFECYSKFDSC